MRKQKQIIAGFSILAIWFIQILWGISTANAGEFYDYAEGLSSKWIIKDRNSENEYRLQENITRAQMAKIALNIKWSPVTSCNWDIFSDVNANTTPVLWDLCWYIEWAANAWIIWKNEDRAFSSRKFRPNNLITRAEMIKMLLISAWIQPTSVSAW